MRALQKILLTVVSCLSLAHGATVDSSLPAIIEKGLAEYDRGGAVMAINAWERGGALENDTGAAGKLRAFKNATDALGTYRSAERVLTKAIGKNSQIVYVAMNFKYGALYMRFWLYHTENDWIVQNFTFSVRPETIMPWLAVEGETPTQE